MIRFATPSQLTGCSADSSSPAVGLAVGAMGTAVGAAMRDGGWIDQSALLAGPVDNPLDIRLHTQVDMQFTGEPIPTSGWYRCRHTGPQQD